jgi:transcription elongation factor Elf1
MSYSYKIISGGYPCEGQNKKDVITRISVQFKVDIEKATRLVSGKPIVLKSGLDHSKMQKFSKMLESTGLRFYVESSETNKNLTNYVNTDTSFACPKCGHENNVDINEPGASCSRCGVIFRKIATKEKAPDTSDQTIDKDIKTDIEVQSNSHQEWIKNLKDLYSKLPRSIKIFWRLMAVVYTIALLKAIFEGSIGVFIAVAVGAGVAWFYIPYYCMSIKGFWPWLFTIVWTFPFGLGLLSESAKEYFLPNDH